ncbi:MAG: CRISPR-associated endoribonuclease Cas2 [candidate division TA06 bacterium 32_111]|uniref:CRISPR-associated endoribonuclease Cas2 n=1 Tax=candidate division WOR-3 bacterium TaxID=2052148 RepID=A0A348MLK4_UNCW3|nr:MAG: CRISPR-associated endoribonuclease Cas2 [candidate division TA06 bacterium 32_111]HAF07930.1 CRISPR-associated endonuclease Cas2 [candidate division WOR-3 bacterium]HCP16368.1 CRISPR-associated endonuclease Cas2 [candidate division WOR-3 bacterium]
MYVIVVYDINEKRVAKFHKFLKRYLIWVQRSVFEGELTESELRSIKNFFNSNCKLSEDSMIIYFIRDKKWIYRELHGIGLKPEDMDNFL